MASRSLRKPAKGAPPPPAAPVVDDDLGGDPDDFGESDDDFGDDDTETGDLDEDETGDDLGDDADQGDDEGDAGAADPAVGTPAAPAVPPADDYRAKYEALAAKQAADAERLERFENWQRQQAQAAEAERRKAAQPKGYQPLLDGEEPDEYDKPAERARREAAREIQSALAAEEERRAFLREQREAQRAQEDWNRRIKAGERFMRKLDAKTGGTDYEDYQRLVVKDQKFQAFLASNPAVQKDLWEDPDPVDRALEIARGRIMADPEANREVFDAEVEKRVAERLAENAKKAGKNPKIGAPKGSITNLTARPPGAKPAKDPEDMDNDEFARWAESVNRRQRRGG